MTDEPLDPRDVLASEILDGAGRPGGGGPADREVATRVAALRRARDAVRAPVAPAPSAAREAAIAAALDAFDAAPDRAGDDRTTGDRHGAPVLAPVTPLRRAARNPRWLGAAAAVAALALGVAVMVVGTGGQDQSDDTAARSAADEPVLDADTFLLDDETADGQAPMATSEEAADVDEPVTTRLGASGVDLGSHDHLDELARHVRETLEAGPPPVADTAGPPGESRAGPDPCEATVSGAVRDGILELDGTASLGGTAVRALVVLDADERTMVVLDLSEPGCAVVARRPLP